MASKSPRSSWIESNHQAAPAVPPAPQKVERLVEPLRANVLVGFLAERCELALVAAESGAEHDPSARESVDGGDRHGDHLRTSPRQRRDERAEQNALGHAR